jgi:S-adenosylmethionine decarboxylase
MLPPVESTPMRGGSEWLVDAFGCDPAQLRNLDVLCALGRRVVAALELNVIGEPLLHHFGGEGGVTGLYLLSESHLTWHTFPESALCTLNLFCCRPRPMLDWSSVLREGLGARHVTVSVVPRGSGGPGNGP